MLISAFVTLVLVTDTRRVGRTFMALAQWFPRLVLHNPPG
jgi:hypothetical protein